MVSVANLNVSIMRIDLLGFVSLTTSCALIALSLA
jgi:hypothetical protein